MVAPKEIYQFTELEEWTNYAMTRMRNIQAERHQDSGVEIWLKTKDGVIGKWSEAIKQGYIEEYRDFDRLREDYLKSQEAVT